MNVKDQNTRLEEYKAGARRLIMRFILIGSLMIAGVGLFILSMTINFFDSASADQEKWAARKELVESGKITPLDATVLGKRYEKNTFTTGIRLEDRRTRTVHRHWVELEIDTIGPYTRDVPKKAYDQIKKDQKIQVYPVDETYYIPAFQVGDTGQTLNVAKLVFLCLASLPLLAGITGFCFAILSMLRSRQ